MNPGLRAALAATYRCSDVNDVLDAMTPVIDAAMHDKMQLAAFAARRDALLDAADDLLEDLHNGPVMSTVDWLRARANEGNPA